MPRPLPYPCTHCQAIQCDIHHTLKACAHSLQAHIVGTTNSPTATPEAVTMFYVTQDFKHTQREHIEAHAKRDDAYRSLGEHAATLQRHGFTIAWWPGRPSFVATAHNSKASVAIYVEEG